MAPQVVRLALVFIVFLAGFIGVRSLTIPTGFGSDGFHRVQAPSVLANRPILHAGKKACMECHPAEAAAGPHIKIGVSCETCHGPAQAHVDDFDKVKPDKPVTRAFCARCHNAIVARPSAMPQIDVKEHNPGQRCVSCHAIHPQGASNG